MSKNESSSGADSYNYVSIDQYYEQVALKLAESEGLGWGISEVPDMENRFNDVYQDLHIRKVFRIVLFTEDGDSMDGGNLTVTMPYEGATTTGKMLSYADKAFMRQLFKIPTDEPEAENSKEVKKSEAGSQKNAKDKDSFFSGKGES